MNFAVHVVTLALVSALSLCYGQLTFPCATNGCDALGDRENRTGCRHFCDADMNKDGNLTRQEFMQNAAIGAVNGQQSEQQIRDYCRDVIKFCDNEGQFFFNAIKTVCNVTGAPGVAVPEDAHCLWEFAFGREWVTRVEFTPWWEMVYATIGDPGCPSGRRLRRSLMAKTSAKSMFKKHMFKGLRDHIQWLQWTKDKTARRHF